MDRKIHIGSHSNQLIRLLIENDTVFNSDLDFLTC